MIQVETHATLDQAASALQSDSIFLAGGTLVMRALNYGEQNFQRIVRCTDPKLTEIARQSDRVRIGAGVTMSQIIASSDVAFLHPVARQVGGPAVRNMATVGGNLFAGHPYGDFCVALLALDAQVQKSDGSEQDLEGFLQQRASFSGVVASVSVSRPSSPSDFRWLKVSRTKPKGVSVLSIAAWLPNGGTNNCRIAFGAMGDQPQRARGVEQALQGGSLTESGVQAALAAIANDLTPPDDALASSWYRKEVAPVHLKRLLLGSGAAAAGGLA